MSEKLSEQASDWMQIDLSQDVPTTPPGEYECAISDARVVKNETTVWLFVTLEPVTKDGEALPAVEETFITVASKPGGPQEKRLKQGLRRLAMYLAAAGIKPSTTDVDDVASELIGSTVVAKIGRRGSGVHAENTVNVVKPPKQNG